MFIIVLGFLISAFQNLSGQTINQFDLPAWVSDNMIFPSEICWTLQGKCSAFQEVSVSYGDKTTSAVANKDGIWELHFKPVKAGVYGEMVFVCNDEVIVINEVLSGNIWLCAGQSNMAMQVSSCDESHEANNDASSTDIRYFNGKQWIKVARENVQNIAAIPFFFAIEMVKKCEGPVGIFVVAKGGTGIEAWVPEKYFPDTDAGKKFKALLNDPEVIKAAREDKNDIKPYGQHRLSKWGLGRAIPASLFNDFIRHYNQLPLTGVIWYQGESNTDNINQASEYFFWLENLIISYRNHFNNPSLLFSVIQLPAYNPASSESRIAWKTIQDAQALVTKKINGSVLIDIKDLGDLHDIHPRRKKEVGTRTANVVCKLISNS